MDNFLNIKKVELWVGYSKFLSVSAITLETFLFLGRNRSSIIIHLFYQKSSFVSLAESLSTFLLGFVWQTNRTLRQWNTYLNHKKQNSNNYLTLNSCTTHSQDPIGTRCCTKVCQISYPLVHAFLWSSSQQLLQQTQPPSRLV